MSGRELIIVIAIRVAVAVIVALLVYEIAHHYGLDSRWSAFIAAGVGSAAGIVVAEITRRHR